jgi:hypothetical protein
LPPSFQSKRDQFSHLFDQFFSYKKKEKSAQKDVTSIDLNCSISKVWDPSSSTWHCDVGYRGIVAERCDSCTKPATWSNTVGLRPQNGGKTMVKPW